MPLLGIMVDFPKEMLELIFSFTDHSSHWAIQLVCKEWHLILKNIQHLTYTELGTTVDLDKFLYRYPLVEKVTLNIQNCTDLQFNGHAKLKCIESDNDIIAQYFCLCPLLKRIKLQVKKEPQVNILQHLMSSPLIEIAEFTKIKLKIIESPMPTKLKRISFASLNAWELPLVFNFIDSGCCPDLQHFTLEGDLYLPQRAFLALLEQTKLEYLELKHVCLAPNHTAQLAQLKLKTLKLGFCEISLPIQSKYSRVGQLIYIILQNNHLVENLEISHCNLIVNQTEEITVTSPIDVSLKNISIFDVASHLYTREIQKLSSFDLKSFKVSLKTSQWMEEWIENLRNLETVELRFTFDEVDDLDHGIVLSVNSLTVWAPPPSLSFVKTIASSAQSIKRLNLEYPSAEFMGMLQMVSPSFKKLKMIQISSYGTDILPLYDMITSTSNSLSYLNLQMISQKPSSIDRLWIEKLKLHSPNIQHLELQGFSIDLKDLKFLLQEFARVQELSMTGPGLKEFDTSDEVELISSLVNMTDLKKFSIGMKQIHGKALVERNDLQTMEQFISSPSAQELYRQKLEKELNKLVWWSETKIWQNLRHF
eukprot:NODE_358_length_10198_cov_0.265076.p1 type:complete len:592 gc:universal NODE_358_length_10198_cov_0.265076:2718-4493(+)